MCGLYTEGYEKDAADQTAAHWKGRWKVKILEKFFLRIYDKGFEAGYTQRCFEDHEDQNRRLEQMLQYGKEMGYSNGYIDGYSKGYEIGYSEGEWDERERNGIVEIGDVEDFLKGEKDAED